MAPAADPKRLTQDIVERLSKTGKKVRLPDHKISGLYLRMTAAGAKTYAIMYRDVAGAQREMALGAADAITLEMARDRAKIELGKRSGGGDPLGERLAVRGEAKAKKARTLEGLADRFTGSAAFKALKPSTQDFYSSCLQTYILPEIGPLPVEDIKRAVVAELLDNVQSTRSASVARSARSTLSALMSFAIERDMIDYNPVSGVKQAARAKKVRERVLTDLELKALWGAIKARDGMTDTVADMLHLLMLLPARRGEVAGMEWRELDLDEGLWVVPAERMKGNRRHELPLSAAAVGLLRERRERLSDGTKEKLLPWVFPNIEGDAAMDGKRAGRACLRLAEKWQAEREKAAGKPVEKESFGPHDLRRTFTTRMAEAADSRGFSTDNIKRVLAHDVHGSEAFASYDQHHYREEKREIVKAWAAELLRIVEGKEPPENVVRLRSAQ